MTLTLEITRRSYAVEIPMDDFALLEQSDGIKWHGPTFTESDLPDGVYDLEFNAHFQNYVYFTIDAEDDTPELHAEIVSMIEHKIQEMHNYMEEDFHLLVKTRGTPEWEQARDTILDRVYDDRSTSQCKQFFNKLLKHGFTIHELQSGSLQRLVYKASFASS